LKKSIKERSLKQVDPIILQRQLEEYEVILYQAIK